MGPPSPPLPLTATNLAMLQARQAPQPPSADIEKAAPDQAHPAPPRGATGRGRLVDILV
jgi:hypothetical protein